MPHNAPSVWQMIIKHLVARPTSYLGIDYRSKSEALLAAALNKCSPLVEYEPEGFRVGLWVPDFRFVESHHGRLLDVIIEYKPRQVSSCYRRELWRKFSSLSTLLRPPFYCVLVCADPFSDGTEAVVLKHERDNEDSWTVVPGIATKLIALMKGYLSYRFDLK